MKQLLLLHTTTTTTTSTTNTHRPPATVRSSGFIPSIKKVSPDPGGRKSSRKDYHYFFTKSFFLF